jgi:hypothetical protein
LRQLKLSPQVSDGNIIYTPTNKIVTRPFEWKEENDGSWKRKVHLAKELYYYTNKGRKLYAYEVIEIYFEIAPNDANTGNPDSEKISELKNSRRAATEDEKWNCHGNTFINGKNWLDHDIGLKFILKDDGWSLVTKVTTIGDLPSQLLNKNDIAVFYDEDSKISHTAIYTGEKYF